MAFRVEDILQAIEAIANYTAGMDYGQFASDPKTRDAVVLNLAIIGEAARHVPSEVRRANPGIEWEEMIANRNVMVHVYFGLKPEILWNTIKKDLPPLQQRLNQFLAEDSD